ncbi:DUF389 domain-containing protein [Planktosalinus lacus]|uniref:Membrane protein n=1 Tax=Planktosalinus lacus TaxID=1526573 RepID=A0A8J2Y963_9FLAO|nr:DUF389 domain-containing protein [Planktosalinus lacus]GGD87054.1 membrane protein [Planktosalinus lacus]
MDTSETNSTEKLKNNAKGTFEGIQIFLSELLDIRHDTDKEETVETIKKEISFKGHNAWILIFSVFVASIGLNVSSTAVVIGAMLISPLMGPIVGVGLSVAINDVDTLKRSLVNLGVMIGLSILTAYLYFLLSPLTKLTPELEARTYPTILDVLIAIFGGLALIVAKTKKGTIASVIFGVAIATALMPPLCTAGYGLAVGNFEYFGGAFYLFTINSIFIALSAFVVSKLLGFPLVKYANSKRRKRIAQIATAIAVIVMIPSTLLFWKLLQQEIFSSNVDNFITENIVYEDSYLFRYDSNYDNKTITVYLGGEAVPEPVINTWQTKLLNDKDFKDVSLEIRQTKDDTEFSSTNYVTLSEMFSKNLETLEARETKIKTLENQINNLTTGDIPFEELIKEIKINYEDLSSISFSNTLVSNFQEIDTIPVFTVSWNRNVSRQLKNTNNEKIKNWLEFKLNKSNIEIREQND